VLSSESDHEETGVRVVECGRGGVAAGIPVGVVVGVPPAPVAVAVDALSVLIIAVPVLVPVGILVLVPVRIVGGAVADKLPEIGLLDDSLASVLHRKFSDRVGAWSKSPSTGGAAVGDHSHYLIGTVGGPFLVECDSIHHAEGAAMATLDPRSRCLEECGR